MLINLFPIYTTDSQKSIKMTIIQPNIHLGIKFNESELNSIKENIYRFLIIKYTTL